MELSLAGGFRKSLGTDMELSEDNVYVQEVLVPDRAYYDKDVISASGSLVWIFPLNLGKAGLASAYLRFDGGYKQALQGGRLYRAEVTVGLFTF